MELKHIIIAILMIISGIFYYNITGEVVVETSGIGQASDAITSIADKCAYVMTPDYGAASQLEKIEMLEVADFIAPFVPLGLGLGRLGNFINAELPGRVADVPWAVIYPGDSVARHPSSLYQFALEGPVLFAILYCYSMRSRPRMAVSGLFLIGYSVFRLFSEFFREPDAHIQFIAFGWLTMGQALSAPMLIIGIVFLWYAYAKSESPGAAV